MLLGRYEHNIDNKGRLAIPAKFRAELSEGLVLTKGIDRCLVIYPLPAWTPLAQKVAALSIADPNARQLRRMVFADATDSEVDKQGRVLIPPHLREYATLEEECIVVGMNDFIEIWDRTQWLNLQERVENEAPTIAERLASMI